MSASSHIIQERLYDVSREVPPGDFTFFSPELQIQLARGIDVAASIAAKLDQVGLKRDNDIVRLKSRAHELGDFHISDTRILSFLGDSGEGKSSVIESLLHCPGLVHTGDLGEACTSVPTEYRLKRPDHTAPFTIKATFLPPNDVQDFLQSLLVDYQNFYEAEAEAVLSQDDYKQYSERSTSAFATLRSAFEDKPEFKEEIFRDITAEGKIRAGALLKRWGHELTWPEGTTHDTWQSTAQSAEECHEKTRLIMQDKLWPFTEIIRVYLDAHVLRSGNVLADLPGQRDTNLVRSRRTESYVMRSDHIFLVSKIDRVMTNQSLQSNLETVLSELKRRLHVDLTDTVGRPLNVSVICTKIEDTDFDALKKRFVGPNQLISIEEFSQYDRVIEEAKIAGDRKAKKHLKRHGREFLLIKARNQYVTEGLEKAYAQKVPNSQLEVFCVGNAAYKDHASKDRLEFIEASGIPDLRKFCLTIAQNAPLEEAKNFLTSQLRLLVNSLDLWTQKTLQKAEFPAATKWRLKQLSISIAEAENQTVASLDEKCSEFMNSVEESLLNCIERRHLHWENQASLESKKWNKWHHTQYDSWCRHNGHNSSAKRGKVDWNMEIIWKMRTELEFAWSMVEDEIATMFNQIEQTIDEVFLLIKQTVEERHPPVPMASRLLRSTSSSFGDLKYRLKRIQRQMTLTFSNIRLNASESNYNSYVLKRMLAAYSAACSQSGHGRHSRQISAIHNRIKNGNLFLHIESLIEDDLRKMIDDIKQGAQKEVCKAFDQLKSDRRMACHSSDTISMVNDDRLEALTLAKALKADLLFLKSKLEQIRVRVGLLEQPREETDSMDVEIISSRPAQGNSFRT